METKLVFQPNKIKSIRALNKDVIVTDMKFQERLSTGGIVLINDDMKGSGIRPRWAQVYAIGPDQEDITVGQYVLITHGRWTRGVKIEDDSGEKTIRRIDINDILLVSDEPMLDESISDKL